MLAVQANVLLTANNILSTCSFAVLDHVYVYSMKYCVFYRDVMIFEMFCSALLSKLLGILFIVPVPTYMI